MKVFKLFAYAFIYGVVLATMINDYPPIDFYGYATIAVCIGGAVLLTLLSLTRAAYWVELENVYIVGGWVSLALFLYLLLHVVEAGEELYTFFIVAAACLVGLLNLDRPQYVLMQHEPTSSVAFARGIIWGILSFAIANLIGMIFLGTEEMVKGSVLTQLFVGPITSQLQEWVDVGLAFLLMLFIVAVPEEIMARVFYLRMGSAVTDVFSASLLTLVSGYAMHAYTRYDLELGTLVLLILTVVWLMLSIAYMRHGLLASVAAHATYNTLVTAAIYGWGYLIGTVLVMIIVAYTVLGVKKQLVVF